jgi:hypothetical protein
MACDLRTAQRAVRVQHGRPPLPGCSTSPARFSLRARLPYVAILASRRHVPICISSRLATSLDFTTAGFAKVGLSGLRVDTESLAIGLRGPSRVRGTRAFLPSRYAWTNPLAELPGASLAPLRGDPFGRSDRHPGHPPRPMPGRQEPDQGAPARLPRQSLRLVSRPSRRRRRSSSGVVLAAAAAPDKLSRQPRCCNAPRGMQPRAPGGPAPLPPAAAP